MGKRAAVYGRVSTELQEKEGFGLPSQIDACLELVEECGWDLVATVRDEGYSGTTLNRPGLDRVIELVNQKALDVLVVHSPDRLSRDAASLLVLHREITRKGVQIRFVKGQSDDTPEGKLLFGMQALIADYERVQILERSQRGMRQIARSGRMPKYSEPFGYRFVTKLAATLDRALSPGSYQINENEAQWVRLIFSWACMGKSLRSIAAKLNEAGVTTKRKGRWAAATIRNILHNEAYTGRAYFNRTQGQKSGTFNAQQRETKVFRDRAEEEWITISVPPIVTVAEYQQANERLEKNKATCNGRPSSTALLSGLVKCSCGLGWYQKRVKGKFYYQCRGYDRVSYGDRCSGGSISAVMLDDAFRRLLSEVLTDPQRISEELEARLGETTQQTTASEADLAAVREELEELKEEETNLLRLAAKGRFSQEAIDETLDDISTRRRKATKCERGLQEEVLSKGDHPEIALSVESFSRLLHERLNTGLTMVEEKELARLLCDRVVMKSDGSADAVIAVPLIKTDKSVKVTDEVFRYNLEGEGLEETLIQMMTAQVAVDLSDLAWNGDTTIPSATTLNGSISSSTPADGGGVTVASAAGYPAAGTLVIESERIQYEGKTTTTFTGLTRGVDGTAKSAHSSGVGVALATDGLLTAVDGWLKKATVAGRTVDGSVINTGALAKEHFKAALDAMPAKYLSSPLAGEFRWMVHPRQRVAWLNYLTSRNSGAGDAALIGSSGGGMPYGWPMVEDGTLPVGTVVLTAPRNLLVGMSLDVRVRRDASSRDVLSRNVRYYQIDLAADVQIEQPDAVVKVIGLS